MTANNSDDGQANPAFFVLSVRHSVEELAPAVAFLVEILGFERGRQGDHWVELSNGALDLRLSERNSQGVAGPAALELSVFTEEIAETSRFLEKSGQAECLTPELLVSKDRIEKRLGTPFGIVLVLIKRLSEDDLGVLPELPANLPWDSDADRLVRCTLGIVPLAFRHDARRRVTEYSEVVALESGSVDVRLSHAVRGLLRATPDFKREELESKLRQQGISSTADQNESGLR